MAHLPVEDTAEAARGRGGCRWTTGEHDHGLPGNQATLPLDYKFPALTDRRRPAYDPTRGLAQRAASFVPCETAPHATTADNLVPHINEALWRVEIDGEYVWHDEVDGS